MARSRHFPLIIVLVLACSACSPQAAAAPSPTAQPSAVPSATPPPPTDTLAPSPTPTPAPTSTETQTATLPPAASPPTPTSALGGQSNLLDCANYGDPKVKITVPDDVGPYKILCIGMSGGEGVEIEALGLDNKQANKAIFTNPVKVCLQGRGAVMGMDIFSGSFTNIPLKTTQEGDFTCVEVTKPGSILLQ